MISWNTRKKKGDDGRYPQYSISRRGLIRVSLVTRKKIIKLVGGYVKHKLGYKRGQKIRK